MRASNRLRILLISFFWAPLQTQKEIHSVYWLLLSTSVFYSQPCLRPPETSLTLSPSFSHPSLHLTFPDQQTDHCSLGIFQTLFIIQYSGVTVDVPSYEILHPLGLIFLSPFPLWLTDHIADHHISLGGIEDAHLELCHWNIQTSRWFKINKTTILIPGCDKMLSCNVVGHVEEHHSLSLGVSTIVLVVFNKLLWIQWKSVMVID